MDSQDNQRTAFDKKWASYALAGGAVLAAPIVAKATPVTIDIDPDVVLSVTDGSDYYELDLGGPSAPGGDYTFFVGDDTSGDGSRGSAVLSLGIDTGDQYNLIFGLKAPYNAIAFDSPADVYNAVPTLGNIKKVGKILGDKGSGITGQWPNDIGTSKYLGLIFFSEGYTEAYKGWVEVAAALGSADLSLLSYGYDDEPFDIVPEPSTMVMMLLGAAGVAALKRRKTAA